MAIHSLQKTQKINLSISEVWDFISSPRNLKEITPDYMGFKIITDLPEKMYAGQIIQYKVTPLLNIPMSWCTEITHVKEHEYFVDEQRQGPYKFWHHQHHIKPIKNGVEMLDIVHYQAPFGIIGELVTPLIVTKKLEEIFEYRFNKLIQLFGEYKEG
jgi:ligand-binding SRPBCC domain-containing protein